MSNSTEHKDYPGLLESGLSQEQVAAIKTGLILAKQIQIDYPQIASDYTNGISQGDIIRKYRLKEHYSLSYSVIKAGVRWALRGYQKEYENLFDDMKPYDGLISPEDYQELSEHVRNDYSHKAGLLAYMTGKGAFGLTEDQRKEAERKAKRIQKEKGVGIIGMPREIAKKAVIARGQVLWTDEELEIARALSEDPTYRHQGGSRPNDPNWSLITERVNTLFHDGNNVRTPEAVIQAVRRYKGEQ